MKHKLTILAVLLMALVMPVVAQNNKPRTPPDKAKYSIVGTMNYRNGQRWLDNPMGKRIDFEYDETRPAMPTDKADLEVRFDFVKTDHPMTKLDFWRYDSEAGEWIYDSEVRQGDTVAVTKMQTNVMLVVDKSSSLKGDFPKVQEAAIEFVNQLYTASREKGVTFRVGIIAFSTIKFTEVREITTLNATNYNEIIAFIRGLKMENGTALYYSLDKALDMLEKDTRDNIKPDEYRESRIYAFTDGLDQASIDDERGIITPTQYYEHLRPLMKGSQRKLIMNMSRKIVRSTMVTVRGDDMTDKQILLFDERAEQICDNVRKLNDMTKLVQEFKELAADLVNSNFMLYCYIPEGANGLVGWTFRDENIKVPRERKPAKFWLGAGLEGGMAHEFYEKWDWWTDSRDGHQEWVLREAGAYSYPFFGVFVDGAWPITPWFSLGASGVFDLIYYTNTYGYSWLKPGFGAGPLVKFTFRNQSALLLDGGVRMLIDDITPYISLGYKLKSPWYFKVFATLDDDGIKDMGIGVGYSIFGGR